MNAKILVVDDDPLIVSATRRVLETADYNVLTAPDGEEALRLAATHAPDLVLLDVNMPGMDGLEVCRRIKADPVLAGIFVIIVSSVHTDTNSQSLGLDMGADGYIASPIGARELLARVQAMLRIRAAEQAARQSAAEWQHTFDAVSSAVLLTDADFNILRFNRAAPTLLGCAPQDMVGRKCYELVHGTCSPFDKCPLLKVQQNKSREMLTFPRGEQWLEVAVDPLLDAQGNFFGTVHSISDITERKQAREALQHSESKYRKLHESLTDGYVYVNMQGVIQDCNEAYRQMLGYSFEELTRLRYTDLTPEKWRALEQQIVAEQILPQGHSEVYEKEYRKKDGSVFPVELRTFLIKSDAGENEGMWAIVRDITERKQAEEALRQSEAALKQAQRVAHVGSWAWHIQSNRLEWSDEMYRIFGLDPQTFTGDLNAVIAETIHPDDHARVEASNRSVAEKGQPVPLEYRVIWPDGAIRTVWAEAGELRLDAHGRPAVLTGIVQDITERKQKEEALRRSEAQLRAILDATPFPIALVDQEDNNIEFWSRSALDLFGQTAPTASEWYQLAYPDPNYRSESIARWKAALTEARQSSQAVNAGVYEVTCRDGSVRRCELYAAFLADRLVVTFNDITERARAEAEVRAYSEKLADMVEERTRELRDAQEQLVRQERLAVLGQLAGGVGHELRNPLSVIANAVYFLKLVQTGADAQVKDYLGIIETETRNAENIIADLLDFARIKSVDREPVAAQDLFHRVLERYPAPDGVAVTLDLPPDLPPAFADSRQLQQVLGNLVRNAFQAMPEGGDLTLAARATTQEVTITIKDTGTGIAPENLEKIFEPLFTTKPKGIGLGLAISRRLAEANDGHIGVQSEPGKGSTFTLYLPIHKEPA